METIKIFLLALCITLIIVIIKGRWMGATKRTNMSYKELDSIEKESSDSINNGLWIREPEKITFHVKVVPLGKDFSKYYCIKFTKNDFLTDFTINDVLDISSWSDELAIVQPLLIENETEAIEAAKVFNTYDKCLEHNNIIEDKYEALLKHYKENPPKRREVAPPEPPMKETLIY